MKLFDLVQTVFLASIILSCAIANNDNCQIHLGEKVHGNTRHRRLITVSLPESCESSDIVSIDDVIDGVFRSFKKVKSIPRSQRGHGRHMVAMAETEDNYAYWYGEDEEDGSTFNYVQDEEGNMLGSMVDMAKDAVLQFVIEDGIPVVVMTNSSDFGPEIHPDEQEHSYREDKVAHDLIEHKRRLTSTTPQTQVISLDQQARLSRSSTSYLRKQEASRSPYQYDDSGRNIDVVVVWTKEAECASFGMPAGCSPNRLTHISMKNLIKLAVEETNTAFDLSGVNTEILGVHGYRHPSFQESSYTSFSSMLTALKEGRVPGVHEMRETYGGDVVTLIVNDPRYCGVGYVGPSKAWMYSVISWNCATGYFSFAHEIGHNLGLEHDRGSARACNDLSNYNYGYRDPQGRFRSILAYGCRSDQCDMNSAEGFCTRVQRFSNPTTGFNGSPIGTVTEDNARKLNEVKATVAAYYPHKRPTLQPTFSPTKNKPPTRTPTHSPTQTQTSNPTKYRTQSPTKLPSSSPISDIGTNVALGKPTYQSTTAGEAVSGRAVDGNINGNFFDDSVSQTFVETNPSWSVLLMSKYFVHMVKVYNRSDCCGDNLSGFKVTLWDDTDETFSYVQDGSEPGPVSIISVPPSTKANRVVISIPGRSTALALAEVEVFGTDIPHDPFTLSPTRITSSPTTTPTRAPTSFPTSSPTKQPVTTSPTKYPTQAPIPVVGTNVALGKPTVQSSTFQGAESGRAVDGNTDGHFSHNSVTQTTLSNDPSWSVLLMSKYVVHMVKIYNRSDCCGHRLSGFKVIVWNDAQEVWSYVQDGSVPGATTTISLPPSVEGNMVQVVLPGLYKMLSLAEVEVYGTVIPMSSLTLSPTIAETTSPTKQPTSEPTRIPTRSPTKQPTRATTSSLTKTVGTTAAATTGNALSNLNREDGDIGSNIARGKPTWQTSTRFGAVSGKAVDGNTDGDFQKGSVTHTHHSTNPTWTVHFLSTYQINLIKLFNRVDCCSERLRGFKLALFKDTQEVWTYQHAGPRPGVETVKNVPKIEADKLEVSIPGDFRVLSLAEVEVFGTIPAVITTTTSPTVSPKGKTLTITSPPTKLPTIPPTTSPTRNLVPTNVARGKPTSQTSTRFGAVSGKAVDGNTDGDFQKGSVTHTHHSTDPTWTVYFLSTYSIDYIKLFNRVDCCSERLRGFKLALFKDTQEVWTYQHAGPKPGVETVVNVPKIEADRLEVSIPGDFRVLSLAEVEVFGIPPVTTSAKSSTSSPTKEPTSSPSITSSSRPTAISSLSPTEVNSYVPTEIKSYVPTEIHTDAPTNLPSAIQSHLPTEIHSYLPTEVESFVPTKMQTSPPTSNPIPSLVRSPSMNTDNPTTETTASPTTTSNPLYTGDVAYKKPTYQSSTAFDGESSRAVDGKVNGYFSNATITHTHAQTDPSWTVNLMKLYNIERIHVHNRIDCCMKRLQGFRLIIWSRRNEVWTYNQSDGVPGAMIVIDVPNIVGDRIEIMLPGKSRILSLNEVQVFKSTSATSPPTPAPLANVALYKPVTQSSTAHDGVASRAVDGDRNGFWYHNSTTHTAHFANPSWSVDLLASYDIQEIRIYNRRDCCQNRIRGFIVNIWKENQIVWSYVHKKTYAAALFRLHVPSIKGDKVEVTVPGKSRVLSLAEVEVYGAFDDITSFS